MSVRKQYTGYIFEICDEYIIMYTTSKDYVSALHILDIDPSFQVHLSNNHKIKSVFKYINRLDVISNFFQMVINKNILM